MHTLDFLTKEKGPFGAAMVGRNSGHFLCLEKQIWISAAMDYDQGNGQIPDFHRKSSFSSFVANVVGLFVH